MIRPVCFLFVLQLMTSIVCAATFTVGPGGTYATLQAAIDAAIDAGGDNEIEIQQGFYFQTARVEGDLSGTLLISGGWFSFFQEQTMDPSLTVLNGNGISRILEINLSGGDLRFEYLSFVGGFAEEMGGGLELEASNDAALSFVSCFFANNRAGFLDGSSPLSSASAIHAVIKDQAGLSLERCKFSANETRAVVGGSGAVEVFMRDSGSNHLNILDCEFRNNSVSTRQADAFGGALSIFANGTSEVRIEDSLFVNNSCESSIGDTRVEGCSSISRRTHTFRFLGIPSAASGSAPRAKSALEPSKSTRLVR